MVVLFIWFVKWLVFLIMRMAVCVEEFCEPLPCWIARLHFGWWLGLYGYREWVFEIWIALFY